MNRRAAVIETNVGSCPRVIASGSIQTTVTTEGAILVLSGSIEERRTLVVALSRELGLRLVIADASPSTDAETSVRETERILSLVRT